MKYALLIYDDEVTFANATPEVFDAVMAEHGRLAAALEANNAFIYGTELDQSAKAKTTRPLDAGGHVVTDGPFAEVTEHLTGFYLIEAADLDEALGYAKMLSGTVEVRPLEA